MRTAFLRGASRPLAWTAPKNDIGFAAAMRNGRTVIAPLATREP